MTENQKYFCRLSVHPDAKAKGEFPVQSTHLYFAGTDYAGAITAGDLTVRGAQGRTMGEMSEIYELDRAKLAELLRRDAEGWEDCFDDGDRCAPHGYADRLFSAYMAQLESAGFISFHEPAAGIKI